MTTHLSERPIPFHELDSRARSASLTLRSTADLARILGPVAAAMAQEGYSEKDVFGMRLALDEALANAVKHGNHGDPDKQVKVRFHVSAEQAVAEVEDEGPGFDPSRVPDPLAPENLERPCGRGLLLMRAYLTWMRYNERGNGVVLCKRRSGAVAVEAQAS